ncbi:MAG: tetratricopeptide repeat protein [Myxococcales bacterium]|nr:tetratricopeptide repeat protein [Myxococcales bacterium]
MTLVPVHGLAAPASGDPQAPATADAPIAPPGEGPSTEPAADPAEARAMAAYDRGTQNYNMAQYEAALADFKEAASLYASPDFQYNIGLCYEKLGKYDEAIRAFATYLRAKPDAEDRPNVENRIQELQRDIERQEREAQQAAEREPAPDPAPPDPVAAPPPGRPGRGLVIAGATLVGVGAAVALAGGIGFGVLASDQSFLLDEIQTGGNPENLTFADAELIDADGRRFEGIQVGMVAGGSVIAVTGAVLLALGMRKRNAARPQASTPAYIHARAHARTHARTRAHARAHAWIGPHQAAGLSLSGAF